MNMEHYRAWLDAVSARTGMTEAQMDALPGAMSCEVTFECGLDKDEAADYYVPIWLQNLPDSAIITA